MTLHFFQHVPFEGPALIEAWAEKNGIPMEGTYFFNNDALPDPKDVQTLVVMGGPMGVYDTDQYPWIAKEIDFIETVIQSGKPVLGVCLGAQLIAAALGARVYKGTKEIGWLPVQKVESGQYFQNLPDELTVFHWHGDTFDLPQGATRLMETEATPNQAFEYGSALALQFHFEMGAAHIAKILEHCSGDLDGSRYVQNSDKILGYSGSYEINKGILFNLLDKLFLKKADALRATI